MVFGKYLFLYVFLILCCTQPMRVGAAGMDDHTFRGSTNVMPCVKYGLLIS